MKRPIHQIRIGLIRAAIWENPTDTSVWYAVTFERSYRDGDEWKSSDSYGRDDLLVLAKLADLAHTWTVSQAAVTRSADNTN